MLGIGAAYLIADLVCAYLEVHVHIVHDAADWLFFIGRVKLSQLCVKPVRAKDSLKSLLHQIRVARLDRQLHRTINLFGLSRFEKPQQWQHEEAKDDRQIPAPDTRRKSQR